MRLSCSFPVRSWLWHPGEGKGKSGVRIDHLASLGAALRRDGSALINSQSLKLQSAGPQFRRMENAGQRGDLRRSVK